MNQSLEKIRVLKRVKQIYPHLSLSEIKKLIIDGKVSYRGKSLKLSAKVDAGAELVLEDKLIGDQLIPNDKIDAKIIFENEDLMVVDKPENIHSVAQKFSDQNTLANWLLSVYPYLSEVGSPKEVGLVNRLDFETSGLILVAKNELSYQKLRDQIKQNKIKKVYHCLVEEPVVCDEYLAYYDPRSKNRKRVRVFLNDEELFDSTSYQMVTKIEECHRINDQTYQLTINLITGFRHQIRALLANLGNPIIGDQLYGSRIEEDLFLHSSQLIIPQETGDDLVITQFPKWYESA